MMNEKTHLDQAKNILLKGRKLKVTLIVYASLFNFLFLKMMPLDDKTRNVVYRINKPAKIPRAIKQPVSELADIFKSSKSGATNIIAGS